MPCKALFVVIGAGVKKRNMYNVKSSKAEEFISDSEIRSSMEYAVANAANRELVKSIIEKARACKGISHREAAVLLECNDRDLIEEMYSLAREIKHKFYGNRIVLRTNSGEYSHCLYGISP